MASHLGLHKCKVLQENTTPKITLQVKSRLFSLLILCIHYDAKIYCSPITTLFGIIFRWLTEIDQYMVANQITKGGPVILNQVDNEFSYNTDPKYMEMLKAKFLKDGMEVPTIFNDVGPNGNFANGPGSVNIYGWDQ